MIEENALKQQQQPDNWSRSNTLQSRDEQPSLARATIQPGFPSYLVVMHCYQAWSPGMSENLAGSWSSLDWVAHPSSRADQLTVNARNHCRKLQEMSICDI